VNHQARSDGTLNLESEMTKQKLQDEKTTAKQFCFEIEVEVLMLVKVEVEGAADEQEAREHAEQYASEQARKADETYLGGTHTIRVPDAEFTKELYETFGLKQ
jgi:hypothetical protein